MNLSAAQEMANELMATHGLTKAGWVFKFDSAPRRFGVCRHHSKTIGLSRNLTLVNERPAVEDTILHEIAHALVARAHGHNRVWQAKAIEIGCNGLAKYNAPGREGDVVEYLPWKLVCPRCSHEKGRARRVNRRFSCRRCATALGRAPGFQVDLVMDWVATEQNAGPALRPKSGVTLRVWEIAEGLLKELGRIPSRYEVMQAACTQPPFIINSATCKTQYSKWVRSLSDERGK